MNKLMASLLLAFSFLSTPAVLLTPALAWDLDKMNAQIENTNVIVGGVCSGTIISKEQRLVLTAYHCVDDLFQEVTEKVVDPKTNEIKEHTIRKILPIEISTNKVHDYAIVGTETHTAKIVASDKENDVALIQVIDTDFKPLSAAPLAPNSYEIKRGLPIFVVGNPGIKFDNSINEGIISNTQRLLDFGDDKKLKSFQTSAPVIGGNSGGAVYNDNGELIGTLSAGVRGAAISFAVPISFTKDMLKKAGFDSILSN